MAPKRLIKFFSLPTLTSSIKIFPSIMPWVGFKKLIILLKDQRAWHAVGFAGSFARAEPKEKEKKSLQNNTSCFSNHSARAKLKQKIKKRMTGRLKKKSQK